jgi:hypothetical protein
MGVLHISSKVFTLVVGKFAHVWVISELERKKRREGKKKEGKMKEK